MAKKENNRDYSGLVESTLKSRYGAKWGLYKYNLERKAQAYMKYAKEEITRDLVVIPHDLKGFVEYGILENVSKYTLSASEYKGISSELKLKKLDLSRTEKLASEHTEDIITVKDGTNETEVILSPATLNMLYRDNAISREEWLDGLKKYRETNAYNYKAYESRQS